MDQEQYYDDDDDDRVKCHLDETQVGRNKGFWIR